MRTEDVIELLGLRQHPEGGWFAETWRAPEAGAARASGSAIYFLLRAGEVSSWHRVDAAETWHHYAGAALELRVADADGRSPALARFLGTDLGAGQRPQIVIGAGEWQSARTLGEWTLVGCTVTPAFTFDGFELAPEGWEPGG